MGSALLLVVGTLAFNGGVIFAARAVNRKLAARVRRRE